ncbi:type I site-specific deoxyribonuclease specificity subunit [Lactococcus cremoris subsp. tructae]|uniref:Type I site-specific deoxyribonuclease specificity subunit n=1 Tax=Lactococcus cremoris subsp. tructae TaxID=542833 RepID=A0A2A5ST47_LACLC|nr:type I site-specific deoxyribonuclease specificity subunit [Lactococcus cremoris subsp. tructae]
MRKFEDLLDSKDGVRRGPFGSALKKEFFVENSEYVVYEQQNAIYDNYHTRYKITKEKFDELSKFKLNPGDFIMSGAGTIGRISRVPDGVKLGVFNQALIRFRINPEITDSEYFIQFVRADFMQKNLTGANPGSAITNLVPMSEVKKWEIKAPHLEEQEKIGSFFAQLDNTIALHQRKLDLLKEQKKGYLQKMFPKNGAKVPELRFAGFADDWEQRKFFESIASTIDFRGRTPKKLGMDWSDSGYLALSALNVKNGYIDPLADAHYGDEKLYRKWMSGRELKKGQVLFTTEAPMGNVAQVPDDNGYILSQRTVAFETKEDMMTNDFLAVLLKSPLVFNNLSALSSGGTAKGVSQKSLKGLSITVPLDIDEQQKIGSFFKQLDNTIALHQRKLDLLKEQKKGYLQKMFI